MSRETITPISRSQAEGLYPYDYTLQAQAPNGGWVDRLSTNDESQAISHGEYLRDTFGEKVRVIYNLA